MAVPVAVLPGARPVSSNTIGSVILGSLTSTLSMVTLPVLVTVKLYSTVLPSVDSTPVFTKESEGSAGTSTSVGVSGVAPGSSGSDGFSGSPGTDSAGGIGSELPGGVPVASATFSTVPASFSACVMV